MRFITGRRSFFKIVGVSFAIAWSTMPAWGQIPLTPATGVSAAPTVDQVQAALHQLDLATDLSPEQRKQIGDLYRECLDELQTADGWRAKEAQFDAARQSAPDDLERLKAQIATKPDEDAPRIDPKSTLDELKQRLTEAEALRKAARDDQLALETEQHRRADRRDEIRALDETATHRLGELDAEPAESVLGEGAEALGARARQMLLAAQRATIHAERASYAAELPSYEATRELLRVRLDDAVHRLNTADKQVQAWTDAVEKQQAADAEATIRNARWDLITAQPETEPLARENERLAQLRQGPDSPAARMKRIQTGLPVLKNRLDQIRGEFARVKQTSGVAADLGPLLLNQRRQLPDVGALEEAAQQRQAEMGRTKIELLDLENRRAELADLDVAVQQALAPLAAALSPADRNDLAAAIRDLFSSRRDVLDDLISDYDAYFNALVLDDDKLEQELLQAVRNYRAYIDEQILWTRSFPPEMGATPAEWYSAVRRLTNFDDWQHLVRRWWDDLRATPQTWVVAGLAYAAYWWSVARWRRRITRLGEEASHYNSGFLPTLRVAALTAICSLPAPAALWVLSSRLVAWPGTTEFVRAFASGMQTTAVVWLTIAVVRQSLRHRGLAEAHFGYSADAARSARRLLWRLAAVGLPATFIAAWVEALENATLEASVGRVAFILGLLCVCRAVHVVLHPLRGLIRSSHGDGMSEEFKLRLCRLRYLGACAAPLIPAILSAAGYHYTAMQLASRLLSTLWLCLGFMALRALVLRGLLVARRRLTMDQARHVPEQTDDNAVSAAASSAPPIDLYTIERQSRRLLHGVGAIALIFGMYCIWVDILPALKFLDRWHLYGYSVTSVDSVTAPDGSTKSVETTRIEWITPNDIVMAGLILVLTTIAARNLPGLLEITCLQWLPIDPGARYAVTTVVRYLIHLAAVVAICNTVGLQWSNVQWLVAAATVGLGFGLQEIFANFISGLIILCERPIRVGDTVTIGDVSGTVSRIRGRATTIVDWDRKELIVPNKEFITGRLMNWTLTDDVLRTVVRFSVARDADVGQTSRMLLDAARSNKLVLTDPEPSVAFIQVGEKQLDFELRVYSSGLANLSILRDQLNTAILLAMHKARLTCEAITPNIATEATKRVA